MAAKPKGGLALLLAPKGDEEEGGPATGDEAEGGSDPRKDPGLIAAAQACCDACQSGDAEAMNAALCDWFEQREGMPHEEIGGAEGEEG